MRHAKQMIAALLIGAMLLALTACGSSAKTETTPKDYTQIIHDARDAEDNEYSMIFTRAEDGTYTAQYGYSGEYEAAQLNDEIANMLLPLLNLDEDDYTDLAASVSAMMVQSYGIAIVMPAEGKTEAVQEGLEAFVAGQQQTMERYLEDQYAIAKAAKVELMPTGEVVLVCCENSDTVLENIRTALK